MSYHQQQQQQPQRYTEEVRIEEHFHRPGVQHQETRYHEEHRPQRHDFSESYVEVDRTHQHYDTPLDCIEREYRERCQPRNSREEVNNCDRPGRIINAEYTVEPARTHRPSFRETAREKVKYTVEGAARRFRETKAKMGYYDDDGRDEHVHADNDVRQPCRPRPEPCCPRPSGGNQGPCLPNTVSIPCNHIRMGDFLMLQGRPCQVIRISISAATGQYRYLGVDLFTKQLHEESSYISNPEPSVVVQTMLGPVFKQYRVLDMHDGRIVAMTETGDVKPDLPVIDQSNLWSRLNTAFECGRGSVRVLVLNDRGRELAVDMKTIHGSRL
ncbi:Woronin body major protein like [Verticillium longisporum]|nr:Woronin body major protein like [Verticillium longisporum]